MIQISQIHSVNETTLESARGQENYRVEIQSTKHIARNSQARPFTRKIVQYINYTNPRAWPLCHLCAKEDWCQQQGTEILSFDKDCGQTAVWLAGLGISPGKFFKFICTVMQNEAISARTCYVRPLPLYRCHIVATLSKDRLHCCMTFRSLNTV